MKYVVYCVVLLVVILVACGLESPSYVEAREYISLINYNGTDKLHLQEGHVYRVSFYNNNQEIIFRGQNSFISYNVSTLQSEILSLPEIEDWDIGNFEIFQNSNNILFCNELNERDIYLYTIDTNEVENLTCTDSIREESVELSPSEEYFAYIEREGSYPDSIKWSIKYRNLDGSVDLYVKSIFSLHNNIFSYVDWINNNQLIYASNDLWGNPGIYKINLDGSEDDCLHEGSRLNVSICEDGSKIVFEYEEEIFIIDTIDFSVDLLISGKEPVISPDGNKLIFKDEIYDLVIWDMQEDTIILLSEDPNSSHHSTFSSDCQKIIFNERIVETFYRGRGLVN